MNVRGTEGPTFVKEGRGDVALALAGLNCWHCKRGRAKLHREAESKRRGRAKTSCASPKERLLPRPSEASATQPFLPSSFYQPPILACSLPSRPGDNKALV